jgi:hypothetical protein
MKYTYITPSIELTAVICESMLSGSGKSSLSRNGSVGADGNSYQDDFNGGSASGVTDVTDGGPSSSAKHNNLWDD